MASRGHAFHPAERQDSATGHTPAQSAEPALTVFRTGPVQLATIAGGKEDAGHIMLAHQLQHLCGVSRAQSETLPNLDRGRMVAYANEMEGEILPHAQR